MQEYIEQFTNEEIDSFYNKNEFNMPQTRFIVTTKCTLKCADCNFLIPYFQKHLEYSLDQFKSEFDILTGAVDKIRKLIFLGGEPLLNPHLFEMIEYSAKSEIVNLIEITINGTMLPSQQLLDACKKSTKTYFHISNYSQNENLRPFLKLEQLTSLLKKNSISYQMASNWTWEKEDGFNAEKFSLSQTKEIFQNCYRTRCLSILNSKLYPCPKGSCGIELGFIDANDYIDLRHENLREKLIDFYKKDYFEACEYCALNQDRVIPALQK